MLCSYCFLPEGLLWPLWKLPAEAGPLMDWFAHALVNRRDSLSNRRCLVNRLSGLFDRRWRSSRLYAPLVDFLNYRRLRSRFLNQGRTRNRENGIVTGNGCCGRIQRLVLLSQLGNTGCRDCYC